MRSYFVAWSQPTFGVVVTEPYEHLRDVTSVRIDSRVYDPNKEEVSAEGSEDNTPADQHRKGAIGLPRVELLHEKHAWKEEAV
jgi:hypothetical protein